MDTKEAILEKHLIAMLKGVPDRYKDITEMKSFPEWNVVLDAMQEFAEQYHRQESEDAMPDEGIREKLREIDEEIRIFERPSCDNSEWMLKFVKQSLKLNRCASDQQ